MTADADTINDQVADSVQQIHDTLRGWQQPFALGAAYQAVSHALGLSLHNAVLQQQHSYVLRNALTTAAAKAILEGHTDQAEAILKLAESSLVNPNFGDQVEQIQLAINRIRNELEGMFGDATTRANAPVEAPPG